MAKRGHIVDYTMLEGAQKISLKEISEKTGVQVSTCSNIIQTVCQQAYNNEQPNLCADENLTLLPNYIKESNVVLSAAQKVHLGEITLQDAKNYRMTFTQLTEVGIM